MLWFRPNPIPLSFFDAKVIAATAHAEVPASPPNAGEIPSAGRRRIWGLPAIFLIQHPSRRINYDHQTRRRIGNAAV